MREITKHIPKLFYVCELCNKEYSKSTDATKCEKTCKKLAGCLHKDNNYYLKVVDDSVYPSIAKVCKSCGQVFNTVSLDFVEKYELKILYESIYDRWEKTQK